MHFVRGFPLSSPFSLPTTLTADGVVVNDTLKIATDGIRVHYTPVFRPYTSVMQFIIKIGAAPRSLTVPPGESRFYVSRSCTVESNCRDANEKTLATMAEYLGLDLGGDVTVSCAFFQPFCGTGIGEGYLEKLCPKTCGLCEQGPDGEVSPFDPGAYRLTAIQYHAHLLGREMYTTLIPRDDDLKEEIIASPKEAPIPKDLESRDFWILDNQETIPFEFDLVKNNTIMRGTEVKPGDKIHATCVYDSTYQTEPTNFYISTYDEMCMTSVRVAFETPQSLLNNNPEKAALELNFLNFACSDDADGDIYTGILTADEDGRDVWKDHPLEQSEGCRYVQSEFFFATVLEEISNCGENGCVCEDRSGDAYKICPNDAELLDENEAGASCTGGTLDGTDSNDGITTKENCEEGGGFYTPYTCGEIQWWLENDSDLFYLMRIELIERVWRPLCCGDVIATDEDEESIEEDAIDIAADPVPIDESSEDLSSAPGRGALSAASVLAAVVVAVAL